MDRCIKIITCGSRDNRELPIAPCIYLYISQRNNLLPLLFFASFQPSLLSFPSLPIKTPVLLIITASRPRRTTASASLPISALIFSSEALAP